MLRLFKKYKSKKKLQENRINETKNNDPEYIAKELTRVEMDMLELEEKYYVTNMINMNALRMMEYVIMNKHMTIISVTEDLYNYRDLKIQYDLLKTKLDIIKNNNENYNKII